MYPQLAVDNGEAGLLTVTLRNQGPNNVSHITMTVTSSNPHVTFPRGNAVDFPPVQKDSERSGFISVALNDAAGLETTDFQIAISSPELGLPSPLNVVSTHRLNYDEQPNSSATETAEFAKNGWTIGGGATTSPNIAAWQRRALSATRHVWFGPDNNGQTDGERPDGPDEQTLVSPSMLVGSGPLTISFQHRYSFEGGGWDGGVVEISVENGAWTDIGGTAYGTAKTNPFTTAPIGANRPAFVNRSGGWPSFIPATLNLGTTYASRNVRIRFRVGADESTGAPGWDIDDIAVSGIDSKPFTGFAPQAAVCAH